MLSACVLAGSLLVAPTASARTSRTVISPRVGAVIHADQVPIRVRSGDSFGALSARLNGVQVGNDFGPARHGIRTLYASISHGLRRGRNVLKVRVRRRHRPTRRATARFVIRRGQPLVGAGRDRRVVVGDRAIVSGGVTNGRRSELRWKIVRAPGRKAATGRANAKFGLASPRGRTALLRPRARGHYVLEFDDGRGKNATADRVAVDAVPPSPLVPVDTGTPESAAVSVAGQAYADSPGTGEIQVLVFDRKTLKPAGQRDFAIDGNEMLGYLGGLKDSKLVTVVERNVVVHPLSDNLTKALNGIGVPDLNKLGAAVQRFSAIGVPGLKPGSADYAVSQDASTQSGRLQGYLTPDQYFNYGFVSPQKEEFKLGGENALDHTNPLGDVDGYGLTIRDPYTYALLKSRTYITGDDDGTLDSISAENMVTDIERAPPGSVVTIQAVGTFDQTTNTYRQPVTGVSKQTMTRLAKDIAGLGGTRNAFNRAAIARGAPGTHGHVYQLIGWVGAGEGDGAESAVGVAGAGDVPEIDGVLRPGRNSQLRPTEAVEGADYAPALADLAMQPPTTTWPLDDNPGATRALAWLGSQDPKLGPDPRAAYWTQNLDTNALITKLSAIEYPPDQAKNFTQDEFAAAKKELVLELGWVGNVHDYTQQLAKPFDKDALTSWATIQDIAEKIRKSADPEPGQVGVSWVEVLESVLGLIPLFGPEASSATHTAEVLAGIGEFGIRAWGAANPGGEPEDGTVTVDATALGDEIIFQANQAVGTFSSLEDVIVSDYAKLSALGPYAGCNAGAANCPPQWALSKEDQATASANVYLGVSQVGYLQLMPLGFKVMSLVPEGQFQRHHVRPNPPDPANYFCHAPHPWSEYPDLARSSTSLLTELDPVGGDYTWNTFVFSRSSKSDLHGSPPPEDLLDRLFNPLSQSGVPTVGGLGLNWTQFAIPEMRKPPDKRNYWERNSLISEFGACGWDK